MSTLKGWERPGELSVILQGFRHIYLQGEVDGDHPAFRDWRLELLQFCKGLLLSCELPALEEGSLWVHFHFDRFCSVLNHSCCDWTSPDAFGCGLLSEVVMVLLEVQSELPVCTPAIVRVLLHRLATLRAGKETKGPFNALVSGLHDAIDTCPAMPSEALEESIDYCLRWPSPGTTWSLRATPMFVSGVLSVASKSPRSLCQAVVPVLVRFVAETECQLNNDQGVEGKVGCHAPCVSCLVAGATAVAPGHPDAKTRPLRCEAQEKKDLILEGLLRWAVDAHFRQCSRLLQASLYRAVCDGVQQALDTAVARVRRGFSSSFPLACRLLLAFVGGLAGDGGVRVAAFLQDRCAAELRLLLARSYKKLSRVSSGRRDTMGRGRGEQEPKFPVLEGYVGHLCLCRHISDAAAGRHLLWLSRQALKVLRLLKTSGAVEIKSRKRGSQEQVSIALRSLCHALALLLTRPKRGNGSAIGFPENAGNLLEIIFDSDAQPLAGVPLPLALAAIGTLKEAGYLQLVHADALVGSSPRHIQLPTHNEGCGLETLVNEGGSNVSASNNSFADRVSFQSVRFAFQRSWSLAAAGLDAQLPLLGRKEVMESGSDGNSTDGEDCAFDGASNSENVWGRVPDEVTLRVFSFLTPKRLCRLACVEYAWRKLLGAARVWRPFFEARWLLEGFESESDRSNVADELLKTLISAGGATCKRKRAKFRVVYWQISQHACDTLTRRDWMALYRDRHRAERTIRGRSTARTNFPWVVCPFLGCVSVLKSEYAIKENVWNYRRLRVQTPRAEASEGFPLKIIDLVRPQCLTAPCDNTQEATRKATHCKEAS